MNLKRILLILAGIIVAVFACLFLHFWLLDQQEQYREPPPYPTNLEDFNTIESAAIDPATLLDDIRSGKKLVLQVQADTPDNPPFLMPIGWSQHDFLDVAQAYQKAIWQDDPNLWHLFKASFYTKCDNASGKFGEVDFYYYQEATKDGESVYSVRAIEIHPEYGYLDWGGDTFYPRPRFGGWTAIDLESITKVPAEQALALADQRGGKDFRNQVNNKCNISVYIFPWAFERSDWSVWYTGKLVPKFGSPQSRLGKFLGLDSHCTQPPFPSRPSRLLQLCRPPSQTRPLCMMVMGKE